MTYHRKVNPHLKNSANQGGNEIYFKLGNIDLIQLTEIEISAAFLASVLICFPMGFQLIGLTSP